MLDVVEGKIEFIRVPLGAAELPPVVRQHG
jgi:hypothetical protein